MTEWKPLTNHTPAGFYLARRGEYDTHRHALVTYRTGVAPDSAITATIAGGHGGLDCTAYAGETKWEFSPAIPVDVARDLCVKPREVHVAFSNLRAGIMADIHEEAARSAKRSPFFSVPSMIVNAKRANGPAPDIAWRPSRLRRWLSRCAWFLAGAAALAVAWVVATGRVLP